jgi:hypothetical protein
VDPRSRRHRPADGRARCDGREHCAALRPGSAELLRQPAAVDRDRLHPRPRGPAHGRRAGRKPLQPQADFRHRPDWVCSRIGGGRSGPELRHARRRSCAAGRLRSAARALRPLAPDNDIHRLRRAWQGVWDLGCGRRQRGRRRPAARRRAHRVPVLALVPVREPRRRTPHGARRDLAAAQRGLRGEAADRRTRHADGSPRAVRARLWLQSRRESRLGIDDDGWPPRSKPRAAGGVRRDRAPRPAAAAAAGCRARPQPRRLLPRRGNRRRGHVTAPSSSSPTSSRRRSASRRSSRAWRSCR